MKLSEQMSSCRYLVTMFREQLTVACVIVVASKQRKCQTKLRRLGTSHIDHALRINKIGKVVVYEFSRSFKATPLELRVNGHGKNILESVVFRSEIIAIDRSIFWIDSARPNHELFSESML